VRISKRIFYQTGSGYHDTPRHLANRSPPVSRGLFDMVP
jgi:hypothetical protein